MKDDVYQPLERAEVVIDVIGKKSSVISVLVSAVDVCLHPAASERWISPRSRISAIKRCAQPSAFDEAPLSATMKRGQP